MSDCIWLAKFVSLSACLESVYVSKCRMDDARLKVFVENGLVGHPGLTKISLTHLTIADDGARILARFLNDNSTIEVT